MRLAHSFSSLVLSSGYQSSCLNSKLRLHGNASGKLFTLASRWFHNNKTITRGIHSKDVGKPTHSMKARIDYKHLQENLKFFEQNAINRNTVCNPSRVVQLYHKRIQLSNQVDQLRHHRKQLSKSGKTVQELTHEGNHIKQELTDLELQLHNVQEELEHEALLLPNSTHPDVPLGNEDADAKVFYTIGKKPNFNFSPKDHYDLVMDLELVDFHCGAHVSGSKFVYLCNDAAMLELALAQWTLNKLRGRHFQVVLPPDVAKTSIIEGCGFHPRGESTQVYSIANTDLGLTGTSEITLAGMKQGQIMEYEELPLRLGAFSHCFRTEAGSRGKFQKGLFRLHQFSKVEMFAFSHEDESEAIMEEFLNIQIEICEELGLHAKVVDMPSGDLGAPAYRKYDLLAWMPGRQQYEEISSLSNCTDFQSRRLNVRYRSQDKQQISFAHTINGTACAIPRLLIAILETYQQPDGSVIIPNVLRPYMGMKCLITKSNSSNS